MAEKTSIAVVGAGAIGSALAAALGDSGYTVTLCDRIQFDGLKRTFEGETRQYDHPVVTSPQGLRPVDWLLLCTKAHQVSGAAPWLECLIAEAGDTDIIRPPPKGDHFNPALPG